jgi:hypothetical protein
MVDAFCEKARRTSWQRRGMSRQANPYVRGSDASLRACEPAREDSSVAAPAKDASCPYIQGCSPSVHLSPEGYGSWRGSALGPSLRRGRRAIFSVPTAACHSCAGAILVPGRRAIVSVAHQSTVYTTAWLIGSNAP